MQSCFLGFKVLRCVIAVSLTALSAVATGHAQDSLDLEIIVGEVTAFPGEQGVTIPIYMNNYHDSIVGFNLWLMLDRPDIMEFQIDLDRTGTLIADWEIWAVNSLGGQGHDLVIFAISNFLPPYTNAIPPQCGDVPLVKVLADVYDIPDTTSDRTVDIHVVTETLDYFSFADPNGNSIGVITDSVLDTAWYVCTEWSEPNPDSFCLNWEEVSGPPADSIDVGWVLYGVLDTAKVSVIDGSLTVLVPICGDVDGSDSDPNVVDLTYFVEFLFFDGPPPPVMDMANVDGEGGINVADLIYLVDFLFFEGPPPACP